MLVTDSQLKRLYKQFDALHRQVIRAATALGMHRDLELIDALNQADKIADKSQREWSKIFPDSPPHRGRRAGRDGRRRTEK